MFKILAFLVVALNISSPIFASIDLGVGPSVGYSGRLNTGVSLALNKPGYSLGLHSSGVQTNLYYDSSYYVSLTWPRVANQFWWGAFHGSLGVGTYFTERGYRSTPTSDIEKASDFALGPSLRIVWDVLGPVFISLDGMYGLRNPLTHVFLSFQDVELISIGIHL